MRFELSPELLVELRRVREERGWADPITVREDAFLMFGGMGSPGYLTSDGRVLIDESDWNPSLREAVGDEAYLYLVLGAKLTGIRALLDLVPTRPGVGRVCARCDGRRWMVFGTGEVICIDCRGKGWTGRSP